MILKSWKRTVGWAKEKKNIQIKRNVCRCLAMRCGFHVMGSEDSIPISFYCLRWFVFEVLFSFYMSTLNFLLVIKLNIFLQRPSTISTRTDAEIYATEILRWRYYYCNIYPRVVGLFIKEIRAILYGFELRRSFVQLDLLKGDLIRIFFSHVAAHPFHLHVK